MNARILVCLVLALNALPSIAAEPFVVFDGLIYIGKPDTTALGLRPITLVYSSSEMFEGGGFDEAAWSATVAKQAAVTTPLVLDIEEWRVSGIPKDQISANIAKYLRALELARTAAPTAKVGYYGLVPERNYWAPVQKEREALRDWSETNRSLRVIADKVDFLFPSLYTFYDNQEGWEIYAKEMLQEARKFKKPVYAFLWPQFHDSNKQLVGQDISGKFWAKQLELCRRYADGIVIWGGFKRPRDENAPWWVATKAFMQKQQKR